MTFAKRIINLRFELGEGDFGEGGFNAVDLNGLRCSVNIERKGIGMASADIQVWGMSLDMMNKLTVLNKGSVAQRRYNKVTIFAGNEDDGVAMVFGGTIFEAWADGRNAPDVVFLITASSAQYVASKTIKPTSFKGSVDAAFMISSLAQQMRFGFENSGVSARLTDPYKAGPPKAQIASICHDIDCLYDIDETKKTVAIWPKGQARDGEVIKVSKDTGLVGYPAFTQSGIQLTSLFNPNFEFARKIEVETDFTGANGQWAIMRLNHQLEAMVPGGAWFSEIECYYLDHKA